MHVEPVRTLLETTRLLASACTACSLHEGRARSVFGEGDPHAELLFVGEAPGPDEDRTGRPFTGRSGALLDRIIEAMGKRREEVYLTNVVTCRLNDDRELTRQQIEACRDHLEAQIEAVDPEIIVPLGSTAWQWFQPGDRRPMHEVRGQVYRWRDRLLVPTYHPAFLLRKPDHKGYVWKDMRRVLALETAPPTMAAGVIELTGESPGAALF